MSKACSDEPMCAIPEPEFKQIIDSFEELIGRLKSTRDFSVRISDLLIGVNETGVIGDDTPKPMPPEYFTVRCFNLLDSFRSEVENLEFINNRLLRHIQVEE